MACFEYFILVIYYIVISETKMSIHSVFWVKQEESNPRAFATPVLRSELSSTALWVGLSPGASPTDSADEYCLGESLFSVSIPPNSKLHKHK